MDKETVLKLAREAVLLVIGTADGGDAVYTWSQGITHELERFAELVRNDYSTTHANIWLDRIHKFVLAEREACAEVCYRHAALIGDPIDQERIFQCAAAIRARRNT